jgi:hypothetical protein
MEKTSKVKNVQGNGTFEWNDETYYKYEIEMENGDIGEYNGRASTQNKFIIGQVSNYVFDQSNPRYPKIKPVYNYGSIKKGPKTSDNKVQESIVRQCALKCAVDLAIHEKIALEDITKIANDFTHWVTSETNQSKVIERTNIPF